MGAPRILVVDDDAGGRAPIVAVLRHHGYVVEVADDGQAALDAVLQRCPDVVFTDLMMPRMDGIALCRALGKLEPELPVIVATGFGDMQAAVTAMREGAADFLTKPLDLEVVLMTVEHAIDARANRLEQELLRLRTEQLYQEALAALRAHQDVVSIVSHDLRNPLGVVLMQAQRLLAATSDAQSVPTDVGRIAESILRAATRMKHLVTNVLDDARQRNGQFSLDLSENSVSDILADVEELRLLAIQKRIALQVFLPPQDVPLTCDRARVAQVLDNLVANAIKFSHDGGTVTVTAAPVASGMRFVVHDDGVGISPSAHVRIFDRHWQRQEHRQAGVGLGLFIAKGIVDAHGGQIGVESRLGGGSTFFFELPSAPLAVLRPLDSAVVLVSHATEVDLANGESHEPNDDRAETRDPKQPRPHAQAAR